MKNRRITVLSALLAVLMVFCGGNVSVSATAGSRIQQIYGTLQYTYAFEVVDLVNQERAREGLQPLTMDTELLEAAMQRSAEILVHFAHVRPDGSSCFSISDKAFGENIAYGYGTPEQVVRGWMNSEGHRANIMNGGYTTIGVGCFEQASDGSVYTAPAWTQLFGYGTAQPAQQSADVQQVMQMTVDADLQLNGVEEIQPVEPVEAQRGDVNADGFINNKDFSRLKAYLADDAVPIQQAAAELTGDDWINNKDLSRLKAYLADDMIAFG